jgi:hypothetical protein
VNNNPDDPTFGGINGKTGSRIMLLPYMMLVVEHAREFAPVEAFCADR